MDGMGNLIGRREWLRVLAAGMAVGQEARVRARQPRLQGRRLQRGARWR